MSRDRRLGVQSRAVRGAIVSFTLAFGELGCYANGVLDRVGVRRSVRDEADAFHSEQRSSAVFGMVEALLEIGKCVAREQRADLSCDRAFRVSFRTARTSLATPSEVFRRHVADKSVGYDDVDFAVVKVASFDVADKV